MSLRPKSVLSEDIAGLDISDCFVAAARVKTRSRGGFLIKNAGWISLPQGADDQAIATNIKKLWRKCRINTYSVCSCFRSRKLSIKRFNYSDIDLADLGTTLRLEVESILRMSSDEFYLDWQLTAPPAESPQSICGTYVVAPRKEVNRHLNILKLAGLTPSALDIPHASLSNLYLALQATDEQDETIAIIHTTDHMVDVVFVAHGKEIHTQTLLSLNDNWQNNVDYLFQNIRDVIEYARLKLQLQPLKKIYLTGQPLASMELLTRLEMLLATPTEYWNPLDDPKVKFSGPGIMPEVHESGAAMLATTLGAALRRDIHHAAV